MRSRRFFHKKSSKNCPPGGVTIFECGAKALMGGVIVADTWESPARGIVEGLREFGVEVYGWDPLLGKEEIEGFGVRALDDMLQVTDHTLLPEGRMDGVIVTVAHDEFRGMGVSGVSGFLGAGAVVVDVGDD